MDLELLCLVQDAVGHSFLSGLGGGSIGEKQSIDPWRVGGVTYDYDSCSQKARLRNHPIAQSH